MSLLPASQLKVSKILTAIQVHPTGDKNQSTSQSHAKTNADGTTESIVPKKLQEVLPESVERAVPNAIHDTGNEGGLHRKQ
jgi:hypothetical protein